MSKARNIFVSIGVGSAAILAVGAAYFYYKQNKEIKDNQDQGNERADQSLADDDRDLASLGDQEKIKVRRDERGWLQFEVYLQILEHSQ